MGEDFPPRHEILGYLTVSFLVLMLTGILYLRDADAYQLFLGDLNPILTILSLSILGLFMLIKLRKPWRFMIYRTGNERQRFFALSYAALLALAIIFVDLLAVFPEDMNVLLPDAMPYYSSLGYVVEIIFHLAPLLILLRASSKMFGILNERVIHGCLLLVSLLEPVFQVSLGFSTQVPLWATAYVGLHIFLINLQQLRIFWRFDFFSMYSFRLIYYLLWHIIWGNLRLEILF